MHEMRLIEVNLQAATFNVFYSHKWRDYVSSAETILYFNLH